MPNCSSCVVTPLRIFEIGSVIHPCRVGVYSDLTKMFPQKRIDPYERFVLRRDGPEHPAFNGLLFLAREVSPEQRFSSVRLSLSPKSLFPWIDCYCGVNVTVPFSIEGILLTALEDGSLGPELEVLIPGLSIVNMYSSAGLELGRVQSVFVVRQEARFRSDPSSGGQNGICEVGTTIKLRIDDFSHPNNLSFYGEVCSPEVL